MTPIKFCILGKPQTAGSKRAFPLKRRDGSPVLRPNGTQAIAMVDDNPETKNWQRAVAEAAREAYQGELLTGPLAAVFTFYRVRPRGHYGSGRNAHVLKESAPKYPATKPDALKQARAIEDALTGVLYVDDAQIVREFLAKEWGEPARCEVVIVSPEAPEIATARQGVLFGGHLDEDGF